MQAALSANAALVFWLDVADRSGGVQEHWGCVVRRDGEPHWERLPGTGDGKAWTKSDIERAKELRTVLSGAVSATEVQTLVHVVREQRLDPLLKHLDGVQTLYVVGAGEMAGVPAEVLAPEYTISYVPSGTLLARMSKRPKLESSGLLALGDPVFGKKGALSTPPSTTLPPGGLLVQQVVPGRTAANAGLRPGDVLVRYGETSLNGVGELGAAIASQTPAKSISLAVWRECEKELLKLDAAPGKLGIGLHPKPAPEAIAERREADAMLLTVRGGDWKDLPGTRTEVAQFQKLLGKDATVLLDSAASEQSLEQLRNNGDLSRFRYLHFATHGEPNSVLEFESALILAQDQIPETPLPKAGEPFLNGQLSAREVLDFWKLDAELVTLSACETALGRQGGGDGFLGFAQAFLTAGSRAVCLSLWKVDYTATSLLMTRFYQNLLGKRLGLEAPMPKAVALAEAKSWLRNLSQEEAAALAVAAGQGVIRGERGKGETLKLVVRPSEPAPAPKPADKPFAHPRFWSAFILIGDPN